MLENFKYQISTRAKNRKNLYKMSSELLAKFHNDFLQKLMFSQGPLPDLPKQFSFTEQNVKLSEKRKILYNK